MPTDTVPSNEPRSPAAAELERVRLESAARLVRITLLIFLAPTLWFARSDFAFLDVDSMYFVPRLSVRTVFLVLMVWGAIMVPRSATRTTYERRVLLVTLGTAACILALNSLRPFGSGLPLRTPLMWLFAYYVSFSSRPRRQFIAPAVLTAGVILLYTFRVESVPPADFPGDVAVLLTVNAIGALLVFRREALLRSEREARAAESVALASAERVRGELSRLRGIIPICSHCKQVRTEVGSWQQLEAYVSDHSDADFSHGICPDCMVKHYGWLEPTPSESPLVEPERGG